MCDGMGVLRAGVVGAGVFGGYHARKYASLAEAELVGVLDAHPERAAALAAELGVRAFDDLDAFLDAVEVVTVASPGATHGEIAGQAIAAGRSVYVEKPLAATLDGAAALVTAAARAGVVLGCGHQERVVFAAMGLLDAPETPISVEAVRRGTPNPRNRDVSAVLDLMIHDLDLALTLAGGEGATVEASGGFDEVTAEVRFAGGLTARFESSRQAAARERTMTLVYPSGVVEIDFLAPSFRNTTGFALNANFAATAAGRDPLGVSVSQFLAAVRGEGRPAVDGEEGLLALALGLQVEAAAAIAA